MNYKNFNKAFILVFSVLAFSCESDDLGKNNTISAIPEDIATTLALSQDFTFVGEGDTFDYSVTLPQSFGVNSTVTSEIILDNNVQRRSSSVIDLEAGSTTNSGSIELPAEDGFTINSYNGSTGVLRVTGVNADNGQGKIYNPVSNTIEINVFDKVPQSVANNLSILLDWEDIGTVNDLDLRIVDNPISAIFGSGATGTRYEEVLFDGANPDGNYTIMAQVYDTANATTTAPINYRLMLAMPDGSKQLFEGTIPVGSTTTDGPITIASLLPLVQVSKTGATFTVTQ